MRTTIRSEAVKKLEADANIGAPTSKAPSAAADGVVDVQERGRAATPAAQVHDGRALSWFGRRG
jgi:hypothetical protein